MNESDNGMVEGAAPLEVDPILGHPELEGGAMDGESAAEGTERGARTETEVGEESGMDGVAGTEEGTAMSIDQSVVVASLEPLHSGLQQAIALLGTINTAIAALVFLTLFVWAERKVKNAIVKFTGGRKNASVD